MIIKRLHTDYDVIDFETYILPSWQLPERHGRPPEQSESILQPIGRIR